MIRLLDFSHFFHLVRYAWFIFGIAIIVSMMQKLPGAIPVRLRRIIPDEFRYAE